MKLCVIGVLVVSDTVRRNDVSHRAAVDGEQQRSEYRALGLVSTNIYNAQLSRMSHCAPVARKDMCAPVARKPICLEFTPEAAVGDILVA